MKKIIVVCCVLVFVGLFWKLLGNQFLKEEHRNAHNIIVIVSDSLRYDVLGVTGGGAKTPNIDWLAQNGSLFRNARSTSPRTMPSSVGMMTGNNPSIYPFLPADKARDRYVVPDSELLLAEILRADGYQTTAYVNNPYAYVSNNLQGFDLINKFQTISLEQEKNVKQIITSRIRSYPVYQKIYAYVDYLLNIRKGEKFFTLMWIEDPHLPYAPPADYKDRIKVDYDRLPKPYEKYNFPTREEFLSHDQYERDYVKELYIKEVESMDERVGFIIEALKKKQILDDTIIVFTSDHGEHFGEHGETSHGGSYFEELVHVPLIFSGPGIPKNKVFSDPVSLQGLTATLADILGVNYETKSHSMSFKKFFNGKQSEKIQTPYYLTGTRLEYQKYVDAVMLGNFKLISLKDDAWRLFDVFTDPNEERDLVSTEPKVVRRMREEIFSLREENKLLLSQWNQNDLMDGLQENKKEDKETMQRLKSLGYIR